MTWELRRFDIYRKIPKDLTQPTRAGAVISICSVCFICFLLISEFMAFMTPNMESSIVVDDPRKSSEAVPVYLTISVFNISCRYLGVDIQDDVGRHEVNVRRQSRKYQINRNRGCRLHFHFHINKVSGNFHVSTHGSNSQPKRTDFSHKIHELRIGDAPPTNMNHATSLGSFNPLNNKTFISGEAGDIYDHYLKIVPSVFIGHDRKETYPYQYTVINRLYNARRDDVGSAIWFRYDLIPITVQYKETYDPFYHFLTYLCGIIGGTFTVAGIIDSMIFSATQIYKKVELNKLT